MRPSFFTQGAIVSLDCNRFLIGYGPCTWFVNRPYQGISFYFPDFFQRQPSWAQYRYTEVIDRCTLGDLIGHLESPSPRQWSSPHESLYREEFAHLCLLMEKGTLQKAVPYAFLESFGEVEVKEVKKLLWHALENYAQYPCGALYGVWDEKKGNLGLTPELLFAQSSGQIHTMALAGTRPLALSHELEKDANIQQEHTYVIAGIDEAWRPYGKLVKKPQQIVRFPVLSHLLTPLTLSTDHSLSFEQVVSILHPTPALGAYPHKEGMRWLQNYAIRIPRGRFGAPVGYYDPEAQTGSCHVAIRQIEWQGSRVRMGAGGGVVKGSLYENEWRELQLKWQAIKASFCL